MTTRLRMLLAIGLLITLTGCEPTADPETTHTLPGDGQWRLVNYWAIWCKPCREEIPALNAVDQRQDIRVLGFNFDGKTGDALAAQAEELGIAFELLTFDPGTLLGVPRPQGLPITVVVAPDGTVTETLLGPQTEASLLAATTHSAGG